jgi:hypothetical protein
LRMYTTTCLYSASLSMTRQLADRYLSSRSPSLAPVAVAFEIEPTAQKPDFDFAAFGKALRIIFLKQSLPIPNLTGPTPAGLSGEVAATKQADWLAHIQRKDAPRTNFVPEDFAVVVDAVRTFAYRGFSEKP